MSTKFELNQKMDLYKKVYRRDASVMWTHTCVYNFAYI